MFSNEPAGYETRGGQQCQFPFYLDGTKWYDNKWYHSCTTAGKDLLRDGAWCSTEVDINRKHVQGKWDYCDDDGPKCKINNYEQKEKLTEPKHVLIPVTVCKTKGGELCMIPFKYRGKEFYNCSTVGHSSDDPLDGPPYSSPWCSTKTESDGNHISGNFDECGPNCSELGKYRNL